MLSKEKYRTGTTCCHVALTALLMADDDDTCKIRQCQQSFFGFNLEVFFTHFVLLKIMQKSTGYILMLAGFYLKTFWSNVNR